MIGLITGWVISFVTKDKYDKKDTVKVLFKKLLKVKDLKDLIYSLNISFITAIVFIFAAERILHSIASVEYSLKVMLVFLILILFTYLIYLAIYDIKTMEIPYGITVKMLIILVALNIFLITAFGTESNIELWNGNFYSPLNNLIGGAIAATAIALIVLITKEKAMGEGDIYIAAIMGLILGGSKLIAGLYITIITAMIFSILYAIKIRRYKNVRIPFIPFLVLGTIATVLLWPEISNFLSTLLYVA